MEVDNIINVLKSTVLEGGRISMEQFYVQLRIEEKPDRSWVTETDLEVERVIRERLAGLIPDAPIVGEEGPEAWTPEEVDRIFEAEYVWSIDPIDGTANYVNRFGNWAISVGLLRNTGAGLTPWLGAIFYPRQDILLYSDGEKAYEISDAIRATPNKIQLPIITYSDLETVRLKSFPINANKFGRWDTRKLRNVRVMGSTVVHLGGVATGSAAGSLTRAHLWDIAGALAVCKPLGIGLINPTTQEPVEALTKKHFNFNDQRGYWNLKEDHLVAHRSAAPFLLDLLERRPKPG